MQDLAVALVDCEMQTESASRRKSLAKFAELGLAKFAGLGGDGDGPGDVRRQGGVGWKSIYKIHTKFGFDCKARRPEPDLQR